MIRVNRHTLQLRASSKAVIAQYLHFPGNDRIMHVLKRLEIMKEEEALHQLEMVFKNFEERHRDLGTIFNNHFREIEKQNREMVSELSDTKKQLLGALFTKEYSFQAAALFNPSIVPHPDQNDLGENELRFILSLRATGEGHISSIAFQTGVINSNGDIRLDPSSGLFTCLKKSNHTIDDSNYDLESPDLPLNEKVIFPTSKTESMGMEDVRLVRFNDYDQSTYYGTYTAYDGDRITSQLLETGDFNTFKIRSLKGSAISDKGMALFPEKINGKYAMISRQGGENMYIMFSDDLYTWNHFQLLMEPHFSWEMVQVGNCGSPVKTDEGWLLLTHGVGPMRTYVISAILLDLKEPSRIVGRLKTPLIEADVTERDGYVPNVVYTCGMLKHGNLLFIPYAASDAMTCFATVDINDLLNEMKK